jgi:hypothetical protein
MLNIIHSSVPIILYAKSFTTNNLIIPLKYMISQASAINMQANRANEQRLANKKYAPNSRYRYYMNGSMAPLPATSAAQNTNQYKYLMNGSVAPPPRRRVNKPASLPKPTTTTATTMMATPVVRPLSMKPAASLVSVIMVSENQLDSTLRQSIYTILKQTHQNLELIIIDNNSQDGTLDFLKTLKDTRLRIFSLKETTTVANCRNLGLHMCKGDLITFQNPTYISTSERLAKQITTITDNSSSVVGESINENLDKVNCNYESLMINRNQFNKFGFFQNDQHHILEYVKRLIKNKIQISNIAELYYLKYSQPTTPVSLETFSDSNVSTDIKVPFTDLNKFNI